MKNYLYILLFLLSGFLACSSDKDDIIPPIGENKKNDTIEIRGIEYKIDSLSVKKTEEGLTYTFIQIKNYPLVIHALTLERTAPNLRLEAYIGSDSIRGVETPLSLMKRKTSATKSVIAAINGDFFDMSGETAGIPLGGEITLGVLSKTPNADWPIVYGVDENNRSYMGSVVLDVKMTLSNGSSVSFDGVNAPRQENYLILYNSYYGMRTRTNQWGEELLLKPVSGDWENLSNYNEVKCKVEAKSLLGNMLIPKGSIVVSAHGSKRKDYTENIKIGDEVTLNIGLSSHSGKLDLKNMTGAESIILQDKKVKDNTGSIAKTRAPRTAIGYSTDENKIYFVIVEGRIERSSGVLTNELGDILLYLGATDGVNLDGGGSSCMVLDGEVQNILSDGNNQMRKVSNIWTIVKYK